MLACGFVASRRTVSVMENRTTGSNFGLKIEYVEKCK